MGSQDSKTADIRLKNQKIQDWLKAEDQGHCQLWINRRTGRHFKAYTIPQTVINDPQQLQRYAFRKTHGNYFVTVEGVLGQGQGFFCSQPRSSFVLVENITNRISDHCRDLTFEQALYILFVSASGYNTLTSFFGPLEPHEDMICINDEGQVKIWLNENLARNEPSPIARGYGSQNIIRQIQGEDYNAFAKRRTKQCVAKLFWIVEKITVQGYPLDFREEIKNISTYFEVVNFVQYYREQHGIKIPNRIPIKTKIINVSKPLERPQPIIQPQVVYPINQAQRVGNLQISRVNNVIYRSSHVRDAVKGMQRSRSDFMLDYRAPPQSSTTPKITFQIRPSGQFQNGSNIGQTPMNSPIVPLFQSSGQTYHFPPPNIVQTYIANNGQFIVPELLKAETDEIEADKKAIQENININELTNTKSEDGRVKINFQEDNFEDEETLQNKKDQKASQQKEWTPVKVDTTITAKSYQPELQKEVQLSLKAINQQQENIEQNQENIHQTQFTFSNQPRREPLTRTQAQFFIAQYPQYPQGQEDLNNVQCQNLLHGSQQYQSFEESQDRAGQNYQDAYEVLPNNQSQSQAHGQDHYVPQRYNGYRSPILEQDQNCSPTPNNDKGEQIQEWQAQLNKFTQSSKKPQKTVDYVPSPIPESENQSSRDPESNQHIIENIECNKQEYVNEMADLDNDDIEKYIRMKYQNYISEPGAPVSQKAVKLYEQAFKYQPQSQVVNNYQYVRNYQSNYPSQQPQFKAWQKTEEFPAYQRPEYQPYSYEKDNIGKQNYQPNKFSSIPYDFNYQSTGVYTSNFDSEIPFKSTDKIQYAPYSQGIYDQQPYEDEYASWKQTDRNRKKSIGTSNIDQKYNKYVLNSQKVKPGVAGRGINSWDVSQILPTDESKVTRQELKPILETFERAQIRQKTSQFGQGEEPGQQPSKQAITYDKLRTLLWEE